MNIQRSVWLPPDGDPRLVRFQQELSRLVGLPEGAPLPPHLHLSSSMGRPEGVVFLGGWVLSEGEPVVEAWDEEGQIGVVRFSLFRDKPWTTPDLAGLPPPPSWRWTKGVKASLHMSFPDGGNSFILWSWESRRGWKSGQPKA